MYNESMAQKKGRPTGYSPAIISKTLEYLETCVDDIDEFHKTRGEKSDSYDRLVIVNLPTIEGLALYLKVNRSSIYEWRDKYPSFSDTLEVLMSMQKQKLITGGLSGDYNPVIAKLVLSANHSMAEKVDTDITSKGEAISINIVKNGGN